MIVRLLQNAAGAVQSPPAYPNVGPGRRRFGERNRLGQDISHIDRAVVAVSSLRCADLKGVGGSPGICVPGECGGGIGLHASARRGTVDAGLSQSRSERIVVIIFVVVIGWIPVCSAIAGSGIVVGGIRVHDRVQNVAGVNLQVVRAVEFGCGNQPIEVFPA
jgi:hypothetical protein